MADTALRHPGIWFPPPLIYLAPYALAVWLNRHVEFCIFGREPMPPWLEMSGLMMVAAGLALVFWALWNFFRARTNPLPHHAARTLVIVAPYTFTRNPMYLGLMAAYAGGMLVTNFALPLVLWPLVWLVVRFYVIAREERYLRSAFGAQYDAYCARVRRWL